MENNQGLDGSAARKLLPKHWQLIAVKMPAREWAKARGTCKAMHETKRTVVQMAPVSTRDLVWTVKTVPVAKKLWLDVTDLSFGICSARSFRNVWEEHNAGLQYLQQLTLIISSKINTKCKRQEAFPKWLAALADVLAKAQDLVTLRLDLPDVPSLPPMTKLEHVNIITCQPLKQETCKWLQNLPSLQTLSIEQSPDATIPAAIEIPPLDLSASQHLKSVSLFHIVPKGFSAPALCSVALWTDAQRLRPKLAHVYSSCCTACSLLLGSPGGTLTTSRNRDYYGPCPEKVWSVPANHNGRLSEGFVSTIPIPVSHDYFVNMLATPAANLTALRIEVLHDKLGNLLQPLKIGDNLPNLRVLRCSGRDIFLRFGRPLKLESLRCDAEFALHFNVAEDIGTPVELMSNFQHMHLFWGRSVYGLRMHAVIAEFRRVGYNCNVDALDHGIFEAMYCAAGYNPNDEDKLCFSCGACGVCLTQMHGITDLFGPSTSTKRPISA